MSQREGHATSGAAEPPLSACAPPSAAGASRVLANGTLPSDGPADPVRSLLQLASAGRLAALPLVEPLTPIDSHLDEVQRDAVARALVCPDLFLIPGPSGTGKTRVAIEIARQVVATGGKVLFLSPDANSLEGAILALATTAGISLVR